MINFRLCKVPPFPQSRISPSVARLHARLAAHGATKRSSDRKNVAVPAVEGLQNRYACPFLPGCLINRAWKMNDLEL